MLLMNQILKLARIADELYTETLGIASEHTRYLGLNYDNSIPRLGATSTASREAAPIEPLVFEPGNVVSAGQVKK